MKFLRLPERGRPGETFLVDVGKLVIVLAPTAADAWDSAKRICRSANPVPVGCVYRLSDAGEVLEAIPQ